MKTIHLLALACALACGCSAPPSQGAGEEASDSRLGYGGLAAGPRVSHPVLFAPGHMFELVDTQGAVQAIAFAVSGRHPGQQTIRWLLQPSFDPTRREYTVRRALESPPTVADFAAKARAMFVPRQTIYVKSHADTWQEQYVTGAGNRDIVPVPLPQARRPPDPPGHALRAETLAGLELDGGSVGIRPPPAGGGAAADPMPFEGLAFSDPMRARNTELWFLSKTYFATGLDGAILGPFDNTARPQSSGRLSDWAVVILASSYYRESFPNAW